MALPVVLSNDKEIPTYQSAKQRIEDAFKPYSIQVGAFAFQTGKSLLPENVAKTLENAENVYVCSTERAWTKDLIFKPITEKRQPLEVASQFPYCRRPLSLTFHLGIRRNEEDVQEIVDNRKAYLERIIQNIGAFADEARDYHMGINIENAMPLSVEPVKSDTPLLGETPKEEVKPQYHAFMSLHDLTDIINGVGRQNVGLTFDTAAYALTLTAKDIATERMKNLVAQLHGVNSWTEFMETYRPLEEWVKAADEYQLSNANGIGSHLMNKDDIRRWGSMGTREGALTKDKLRYVMQVARERGVPCTLETEHKMPLDYREDNEFLSWILSGPGGI